MQEGRWNSEAYKIYCKLGRSTKLAKKRELSAGLLRFNLVFSMQDFHLRIVTAVLPILDK